MPKHNILINGTTWTRGEAEPQISRYLWTEGPGASGALQPLSGEAESFIRQFIEGGPQESTFLTAIEICVRWVSVGRKNPTLVFRFANSTSRSISYRSLRDSEETTAKKKELRALRWVTERIGAASAQRRGITSMMLSLGLLSGEQGVQKALA
jgi:hypothetical protein